MNERNQTPHAFLEEALNDAKILNYTMCFALKGVRYPIRFG
jgi:hypothetical protein